MSPQVSVGGDGGVVATVPGRGRCWRAARGGRDAVVVWRRLGWGDADVRRCGGAGAVAARGCGGCGARVRGAGARGGSEGRQPYPRRRGAAPAVVERRAQNLPGERAARRPAGGGAV